MENKILFIAGKKLCCDEFLLTAKIIQFDNHYKKVQNSTEDVPSDFLTVML